MTSIDLIPAEFREGVARQRYFRVAVWSVVATCTLTALLAVLLARAAVELKREAENIRAQYALSELQQAQLSQMDLRLSELDQEWMLLRGLRSGAAAEELFLIIDQALPDDDVWFINWNFKRAGVIVAQAPQSVNTGYFIVVPPGQQAQESPEWQVKTHMNISGQARDHAALSKFVRGLYAQTEIQNVKLNHTRVRKYDNTTVVDFELAVVLHNEPAV